MKYWENRDVVQHTVPSSKSDLVLKLGLVRGNLVWRSVRIPGIAQISSGKEVFLGLFYYIHLTAHLIQNLGTEPRFERWLEIAQIPY